MTNKPLMNNLNYRNDIQALRGIAVLAVVLFHANEKYFPAGFLGVDVFFVISGFVVTPLIIEILSKGEDNKSRLKNLRYFYKRRFFRLAPALSFSLIFSSILIFLLGSPDDHARFAHQGIATLLLIGNLGAYKFSGDYFTTNPNPLVHTWSLSVEEQIFILLPIILLMFFSKKVYLDKLLFKIFTAIILFSTISFLAPWLLQPAYSKVGIRFATQFSFYSPIDRIWQFLLGGVLFLTVSRNYFSELKIKKFTKAFYILALIILLFAPIKIGLKTSSALATTLTILVILFKTLNILPNKVTDKLKWFGDRSYSIYLIHMPLLYIANYSPAVLIGNTQSLILQQAIGVLGSIAIGSLIYSKVENRFRSQRVSGKLSSGLKINFLIFLLILPLSIFTIIDKGVSQHYWGLDKNIVKPIFPENIDLDCVRKSELVQPCTYPISDANQTAILIGDSHAGHISQAFIEAAHHAQFNAIVWALSSCRVKFTTTINSSNSVDCKKRNLLLRKFLVENKPLVVIVSQYITFDENLLDIQNALFQLKNIVPNVLIIENTPVFSATDGFMQSRPLIMPASKPNKTIPISELNTQNNKASDKISLWARGIGLQSMNVNSLFCSSSQCTRYLNGEWLYRDGNHFTLAGAELLIPKIISYLKQVKLE